MGKLAAKKGDKITATDTHIVQTPAGAQLTVLLPFSGIINGELSPSVKIMGQAAATVGSTADNTPAHIEPLPNKFVNPPKNKGTIKTGSATVKINGKAAARAADAAMTCNDPIDLPVGLVVAAGSVSVGD